MVDLAGSERNKLTGNNGEGLLEVRDKSEETDLSQRWLTARAEFRDQHIAHEPRDSHRCSQGQTRSRSVPQLQAHSPPPASVRCHHQGKSLIDTAALEGNARCLMLVCLAPGKKNAQQNLHALKCVSPGPSLVVVDQVQNGLPSKRDRDGAARPLWCVKDDTPVRSQADLLNQLQSTFRGRPLRSRRPEPARNKVARRLARALPRRCTALILTRARPLQQAAVRGRSTSMRTLRPHKAARPRSASSRRLILSA